MRAGVFLCECGGNISGVVELGPLAEHARTLDGVVEVNVNQFMCGTEGRVLIEKAVEERGLDHFVIASCSPRFQGPTFERIARELKLGENAVAFGNIREGCSFIHKDEPERAQAKARTIVEGAVARLHHMSDLPRRRTFLNRSVLVVGGGIAGLSAAEELADAGIEVHLVERQQSIGGYMARLSKTFPTEDCAMCSLAPRLTNAATDSRIHIHALSDVTSVTGPPGEFSVTVRHRPRYVDEKCVGCGECAAVCPVTYPNEFDFGVAERTAVSRPVRQRRAQHVRRRAQGLEPVQDGLPGAHLGAGLRRARGQGPLRRGVPRGERAQPVPERLRPHLHARVRDLVHARQRRGADRHRRHSSASWPTTARRRSRPRRCPSSTTSRWRSWAAGPQDSPPPASWRSSATSATVFEALPVAGGMLRVGIPEYRLPRPALQGEIDRITALGIELKTGARCGTDFTVDSLFADGYKAVFLATGLHQSQDAADRRPGAAGRRARRRVPARAGAGRGPEDRRKRGRRRRRRRRLRRRPHRVPLRRRARHARVHRGRAHRAGLVRGGRGGSRGAGPCRVLPRARARSWARTASHAASGSSAARSASPTSAAGARRSRSRARSSNWRPTP